MLLFQAQELVIGEGVRKPTQKWHPDLGCLLALHHFPWTLGETTLTSGSFSFFLQERNCETKDPCCFDILQKQTHGSGKDSGLKKTWMYLHETLEKTNLIYGYRVGGDKRFLKIVAMVAQHCECS